MRERGRGEEGGREGGVRRGRGWWGAGGRELGGEGGLEGVGVRGGCREFGGSWGGGKLGREGCS